MEKTKNTKIDYEKALNTWLELNDELKTADEPTCQELLRREREGKNRQNFINRIYSRYNKARRDREFKELQKS